MVSSTVVASNEVELTDGLAALAEHVRLAIIRVLSDGEHCVCDLHDRVPVAANLLSYHLRVLREAGLVIAARRGRWVEYRLDGEGFARMWATAARAGLPLPGAAIAAGQGGRSCEQGAVT